MEREDIHAGIADAVTCIMEYAKMFHCNEIQFGPTMNNIAVV